MLAIQWLVDKIIMWRKPTAYMKMNLTITALLRPYASGCRLMQRCLVLRNRVFKQECTYLFGTPNVL